MRTPKTRIAVAATVAAVAVGSVATGSSSAQKYDVPKDITIKMVLKGKKALFKGPKSIERGAKLTLLNTTKVKKIGPHTFTLIDPALRPTNKKEAKACGEEFAGVCGAIAKAHKVNPKTFEVGKHLVKAGKGGWDKQFSETKKGDSWYTEELDEEFTQKVTAKVGTKLSYFCIVHPDTMQGTLKVK
jgi:hypothetical protein